VSGPIVIAHRGASAYRPEHTLAAYALAVGMGADYIEPDLVPTRDGVLVARHENELSGTTDVARHPEFAARRTTKEIDGRAAMGWFTEDFTLAELRTLRARERLPELRPANTAFDGLYAIPTLQEVIDLAQRAGVGIYPETKHPTYFESIGLSLEEPLLEALRRNGWDGPDSPVFIQSFEAGNLRALRALTRLPLVRLLDATADLAEIAGYADAIGPRKDLVDRALVDAAHRAGLAVHPYAFRPENEFLPDDLRAGDPASPEHRRAYGDQPAELKRFYELGVDGLFADNPDTAVAVREHVMRRRG
jgi:glycerophosphoryl diester phosphodiesterase